nr:ribonuclease H-like domain, reverse transcriptase, RNA-dependent DNA polymerase [Tanacetum cinerariifolium]
MNYQPVVTRNQPNSSVDPKNIDADVAFDVKENESAVHVSPSSSDKPKKHDEKAKKEAKGKSLVDLSIGVKDLSDEFEEFLLTALTGLMMNKAQLVAQGHTQEEGIYYKKVFAPVARIEDIRLFLAYASFMGFMVYQMDVKSVFLYGTIKEEVYVYQPIGFEDPNYPAKVYKVVKALYGLHQTPRAWITSKAKELCKYVVEILKKFDITDGKSASTHIDTKKPLLKDPNGEDVDVHIYRLMIGSLMYLTSSRPDILFAVCACARFQVSPKVSYLHAVKRIFRKQIVVATSSRGKSTIDSKSVVGLW